MVNIDEIKIGIKKKLLFLSFQKDYSKIVALR